MSGNVSLDFANTAEWHAGADPQERLTSYAAALEWGRAHGIMSESQFQHLVGKARAHPEQEAAAFSRILALREAVYRIFSAVSHHRLPAPADLETLNTELSEALPHLRLVAAPVAPVTSARCADDGMPQTGGEVQDPPGFSWAWTGMEEHLTSILWPVARSATELLTSRQLVQVRECADETCGWLFLDQTKNASRRWCDMADCGNRAKARRYRERKKAMSDA